MFILYIFYILIYCISYSLLEPPNLDLEFRDKVIVRVGETCTLQSGYSGKPTPTIKWFKNDEELQSNEEIALTSTKNKLCLTIAKAKRDRSGKYTVVLENSIGSRKGICTVIVVGKLIFTFVKHIIFSYLAIIFANLIVNHVL